MLEDVWRKEDTSGRLVVLVPAIGRPEVLPPEVNPSEVFETDHVHACRLSPTTELFWSSASFHLQEVNDFASRAVGYMVKGDACVVHNGPYAAGRWEELLEQVRRPARHKRKEHPVQSTPVEEIPTKIIRETAPNCMDTEDCVSKMPGLLSVAPQAVSPPPVTPKSSNTDSVTQENDTDSQRSSMDATPVCLQSNAESNTTTTRRSPPPPPRNPIPKVPANVLHSSKTHIGAPTSCSATPAWKTLSLICGSRMRGTRTPVIGTSSGRGVEHCSDEWNVRVHASNWADLHPYIIGYVGSCLNSGKGIVTLSTVCKHWRKSVLGDTQLLRGISFCLDMDHPLRKVCECCGVTEITLRRRHCGSLPMILHKAADLNNCSALTCLASVHEACSLESEALKYWKTLAKLGDPQGGWKYGEALYKGKAGVSRDSDRAQDILLKAGKKLMSSSVPSGAELLCNIGVCLGYMFLDGEVGRADNEKAVEWFRIAAEKGSRDAEIALGWLFKTGQYG